MKVISLFDYTGVMVCPWQEAGYDCLIVDRQHKEGVHQVEPHLYAQGADMRAWVPPRDWIDDVAFVAAFPPCDHMAVSGARWFRGKGLRALAQSIELFAVSAEWCEWFRAPYCIENPVSTISTYWREPDHIFHPWHYCGLFAGDEYTKTTCLWTGNGFVMPEPCHPDDVEPDDRIHKAAPGPDRANIRSATPMGFARAVFAANAPRRRAA